MAALAAADRADGLTRRRLMMSADEAVLDYASTPFGQAHVRHDAERADFETGVWLTTMADRGMSSLQARGIDASKIRPHQTRTSPASAAERLMRDKTRRAQEGPPITNVEAVMQMLRDGHVDEPVKFEHALTFSLLVDHDVDPKTHAEHLRASAASMGMGVMTAAGRHAPDSSEFSYTTTLVGSAKQVAEWWLKADAVQKSIRRPGRLKSAYSGAFLGPVSRVTDKVFGS
jgi:hypothetical protein